LDYVAIIIVLGFLIAYIGQHLSFSLLPKTRTPEPHQSVCTRGKVGLLAGHWKSSFGAVCQDGIKEVDINLTIAELVTELLQQRGYQVDLLAEFDPRLHNYGGDVFVALHADSCVPNAHGFKVASPTDSPVARENEKLVECLWSSYETSTGLARQPWGITPDMLEYHAFRKIDPRTPAAILEMGFISTDRAILLDEPARAAQGIVAAIECFFDQK
jgi:N-acetylmuramoyl-L-alanine amidase